MNGQIIELYTDDDMARMRRYIKRRSTALVLLAIVGLAACLALVALTNTANARRMELAAVAVSTVVGWIVLYGALFAALPARRELGHAGMLRRERRQRAEGTVSLTDESFTIRKSVAVRRVLVTRGDEQSRFLVCGSRAEALAAADPAAVYVCHGYVAAYEVRA